MRKDKLWKQTDKDLVKLCLKGQATAWECLVERYKNLVYHFPAGANLAQEDREEVFQETFLGIYKSMEKLLEVDNLDQWIGTVAKRHTWKVLHRRRRFYDECFPSEYDVEDPGLIPEEVAALKLEQARVRRAMGMLNDKCKKLLTLLFYHYESADYEQVAEDMKMARGSIGPLRQRCLGKFREILEDLGITKESVSEWLH